jgi:preprotein translocase subunit SecF
VIGLVALGGPKWSVDFTGGTLVQVMLDAPRDIGAIRSALDAAGLGTSEIQRFGETNEYLIRADRSRHGDKTADVIVVALRAGLPGASVEVRRTEDVGPKVGTELKWGAVKALSLGLIAVLIYVGVRYEFRFAAAGVIALFHDVIFVTGAMTILGREFSLGVVAALLTIAGYSINDTIIVFDRIRETMRTARRESFADICERSINRTLSRTVLTSGLTMVAVMSLFLFGGEVNRDFALALMIGIFVGTYSSIFVAGAIVVDWRARDQARAERKRVASAGERLAAGPRVG